MGRLGALPRVAAGEGRCIIGLVGCLAEPSVVSLSSLPLSALRHCHAPYAPSDEAESKCCLHYLDTWMSERLLANDLCIHVFIGN